MVLEHFNILYFNTNADTFAAVELSSFSQSLVCAFLRWILLFAEARRLGEDDANGTFSSRHLLDLREDNRTREAAEKTGMMVFDFTHGDASNEDSDGPGLRQTEGPVPLPWSPLGGRDSVSTRWFVRSSSVFSIAWGGKVMKIQL